MLIVAIAPVFLAGFTSMIFGNGARPMPDEPSRARASAWVVSREKWSQLNRVALVWLTPGIVDSSYRRLKKNQKQQSSVNPHISEPRNISSIKCTACQPESENGCHVPHRQSYSSQAPPTAIAVLVCYCRTLIGELD